MPRVATDISTIAIDIDDVIAATTDAIRLDVNKKYNIDLAKDHYAQNGEYWGYYERIWESHGLISEGIFDDFVRDMLVEKTEIRLLPGSAFAISEIMKKNKVVFITSRDPSWIDYTKKWLKTNLNRDNFEIYFAKSHLGSEHKTKGEICSELGVSTLIDDNTEHCKSAIDKGIKAVLYGEYGWHLSIPEGVIRCKSWSEVLEIING